jgi:DNA adenine methylase
MRYFGGKARLAKELSSIINGFGVSSYHEPFCGMYSVGACVTAKSRSAGDAQPDLILLHKAVQSGWVGPEFVSEQEYNDLRTAVPSALRAFAGFGCSNSGKFFGGYARESSGRNFAANARTSLLELAKKTADVSFRCQSYLDFDDRVDLIYCDPPYAGTTGFTTGKFNVVEFWDWVREKARHATVLVSEYTAPDWAKVLWQKKVKTDMNSRGGGKLSRVEKLFCVTPEAAKRLPASLPVIQTAEIPCGWQSCT